MTGYRPPSFFLEGSFSNDVTKTRLKRDINLEQKSRPNNHHLPQSTPMTVANLPPLQRTAPEK